MAAQFYYSHSSVANQWPLTNLMKSVNPSKVTVLEYALYQIKKKTVLAMTRSYSVIKT